MTTVYAFLAAGAIVVTVFVLVFAIPVAIERWCLKRWPPPLDCSRRTLQSPATERRRS